MRDCPLVLLLDMGLTFMFHVDRFHDRETVLGEYHRAGGTMSDAGALAFVQAMFSHMQALYADAAHHDAFPAVRSVLADLGNGAIPDVELDALEETVARLEVGSVPRSHADALGLLRRDFRLGVVSNIWSRSPFFRDVLDESDLIELFDVLVFSSDGSSIKPSPQVFERAISAFPDVPRNRIWFVGDDPVRDIEAAAALGLATIWINRDAAPWTGSGAAPDLVVPDLMCLLEIDWQSRPL
jgi:FMN phosphatase YigB (HAD superfamily)